MEILKNCYEKAIEVLEACSTKNGFYASAGKEGYNAVWSRDSMITSLGASLIGEKFKETFKKSIITLSNHQGKKGQIPNAVDKWSNRKPHIDFQTIDSSLWYLIGHIIYSKRYKENSLLKKYKKNIQKTLNWLECQDIGENELIAQLPTTDWQDAFPHKYGYTINTHALYYYVLNLIEKKKTANKIKKIINNDRELGLWNGNFYWAYRWKNHNKYKEVGEWFDSLGNVLAIIFELADKKKSEKILNYVGKNKINSPFPVKTIYPPIKKGDKEWKDYFLDCDAKEPYSYSNGGVWGYNGCFYVLALIKLKKFEKAEKELKKIAEGNLEGNFPEWIHPKTKKSFGKWQAWEAGMYVLAYESLKKKRVLI
jgi:glycogen debranching enzyme